MRNRNKKPAQLFKNGKEKLTVNARLFWLMEQKLFISVTLRMLSVILTKTFFVADEYWQSTEVAHYNVFGYGYLTWEWKQQIRSYFYPFLFEIYFRIIRFFSIDHVIFIIYGPHVIQSLLTSCCDMSVYYLTLKLFGSEQMATLAFFNQVSSWFLFYTGSRTLSNTAEMCFSTFGVFYLFKSKSYTNLFICLLFGGIACAIRPTSVVFWFPLVLNEMLCSNRTFKSFSAVLIYVSPLLLVLVLGLDYYFYKKLVLTHWNFLKFNVLENMSKFYGSHPFYWYFSEGLPVVFNFSLAFIFIGAIKCGRRLLLWILLLYIISHSLISHKEFRFMLPTIPIASCYAGCGLSFVSTLISKKKFNLLLLLLVIANTLAALYFCLVHQRGSIDVIGYLSKQPSNNIRVLFLMPCHSTPYYSYLHRNISLQFLTCHPSTELGYVEEADAFYLNPISWLKRSDILYKTHLVAYDVIPEVASFFHTHFPEGKLGRYIDVYEAANKLG